MTPRQRALHDKIAGKRGKVGAPYQIWLYSPELATFSQILVVSPKVPATTFEEWIAYAKATRTV